MIDSGVDAVMVASALNNKIKIKLIMRRWW